MGILAGSLCLSAFRSEAKRKTEEALVLHLRLQIKLVTGSMCSACLSAGFVPLRNLKRIHSPRASGLKPEELEAIESLDDEGDRFVIPAGKEFLCRWDILGVPGVLDGLSHVVSYGLLRGGGRRNNDVSRAVAAGKVFLSLCEQC